VNDQILTDTPVDPTEDQPAHDGEALDVPLAELRPALEAVLMVADQPLDTSVLATAVGYPVDEVGVALHALAGEYADQGRGFELRNVAGGWRYYTRDAYAAVVAQFVLDGQQARLTQAALETLAVVAYKQPISRGRVSAIRGVSVDGVMRTLLTRGLVEEAGQDAETGAHLYRTSRYFLERIGVTSLDELPELAPYLPDMDDMDDEMSEIVVPEREARPLDARLDDPETDDPETDDPETDDPEPVVPDVPTPDEGPSTEPDGGTA
jgi:segregation and condensation protein B